jgi:glycosyltransferase involved in cell wall biosynthesis
MKFKNFLENRVILNNGWRNLDPEVSIVMPTFCRNQEGLLSRCLDSVLAQTFKNFEFIIVDDGSVDGTEAVIRRYAEEDSRIIYVRHAQNSGLPAVRADEGILLARAPYVTFIFDDNVWFPDTLSILKSEIETGSWDVVHGNTEMVQGEGKSFLLGPWPLTIELLQHLNTIPNGATLCRRSFFDQYGLYDPHLILRRICDWDLWLRGVRLGAKFKYVNRLLGSEFGHTSPVSIGRSVEWDYKVTYAYMVCEERMEERTAAIRPSTIDLYDVFDPEIVLPFVRDLKEWEHVEKIVYTPFLKTHPDYCYTPPATHNRRYDPSFNPSSLNSPHPVFKERKRILLVTNLFNRLVREFRDALSLKTNSIVLSCSEWQVSAFLPADLDLVILYDCAWAPLQPFLQNFREAGIPILYVVMLGRDEAINPEQDPLNPLDLASFKPIQEILRGEFYFPMPGRPWIGDFLRAAEMLMDYSDQIIFSGKGPAQSIKAATNIIEMEVIPNFHHPGSVRELSSLVLYLGNSEHLPRDTIQALEQLLKQTPTGEVWKTYVFPDLEFPEPLKAYKNKIQLITTHESLPTLTRTFSGTFLVVPKIILDRYAPFYRLLLEEDLSQRDGALIELESLQHPTMEVSFQELRRREIKVFWNRIAVRGKDSRTDSRELYLANLALASWIRQHLPIQDFEMDPGPTKVLVLLNSPMLSGSETVGLLLVAALSRLGFDAQACTPKFHEYGDEGTSKDVDAWLHTHGLPLSLVGEYGLSNKCFFLPEGEVLEKVSLFQAWLNNQNALLMICAGFIPEPVLISNEKRLVFMALMQPWNYFLDLMTFLRYRVHGVFSDSRWATSQWGRWLAPPVEWIPTILEKKQFIQLLSALPLSPIWIAIGGTIQPRKRQMEALLAIETLLLEGYDLEINIYGYELTMMADYISALKSRAEQPPLQGKVYFRGLVDIQEIVNNNHIFLMASIDESMPQTLLFVMAGGLVPIACPAGGIPEVVIEGETGFLAKGFSVEDISDALRRALNKRQQWPDLVSRGRELLVQEYSEPIVVHRLLKLMLQGAEIASSPGQKIFQFVEDKSWEPRISRLPQKPSQEIERIPYTSTGINGSLVIGPCFHKTPVQYRLIPDADNFSGLQFSVGTFRTIPMGTMKLSIRPFFSDDVLREVDIDLSLLADNLWYKVRFDPIIHSKNIGFNITISAETKEGRCALYEFRPSTESRVRSWIRDIQRKLFPWIDSQIPGRNAAFFPLYHKRP